MSLLLGQLQREIGRLLQDAGLPDSRREAAWLLAAALDLDLTTVYTRSELALDDQTAESIKAMAARRAQREPLAYITGRTFFMDLSFEVGPGVLVPRADSEVLVEAALAAAAEWPGPLDVLDVCTGSGCIGVSLGYRLLQENRLGHLMLTEMDPDAAAYALKNLARHGLQGRAKLEMTDLFPRDEGLLWDLIVANPPYIPCAEIESLMPEVSRYEPRLALDGGPDGLIVLRRLIAGGVVRLKPGGILLLEHGYDQADALAALLAASGRYEPLPLVRDYAGLPRVSGGRLRTARGD